VRVLAFDTSTPVSAVAVLDGDVVLAEDDRPSEARHGAVLLPRVQSVLAEAGLRPSDVELVAVGIGPGSFTGLRIGLASAKGLALALSRPLRGVCSLRALSAGLPQETALCVAALDAGKGELFVAAFARERAAGAGVLVPRLAPTRATPERALGLLAELGAGQPAVAWGLCGSGARRYPALAGALGYPPVLDATAADGSLDAPAGRHVGRQGLLGFLADGASDLATLEPSYLRDADAKLPPRPLVL